MTTAAQAGSSGTPQAAKRLSRVTIVSPSARLRDQHPVEGILVIPVEPWQ
jgi:hypothetical protein